MKKFFLLSVLFIFMGNLSATKFISPSGLIQMIDGSETRIAVYCVAGYVFVSYGEGGLTAVNEKRVSRDGTLNSVPMACYDYGQMMKK